MDTQILYAFISALEAQTEANSISPTYLGNILRHIAALITRLPQEYAPINHAKGDHTYGLGTAANFGHVKLRDSLTNAHTYNSTSGTAATPAALNALREALTEEISSIREQVGGLNTDKIKYTAAHDTTPIT